MFKKGIYTVNGEIVEDGVLLGYYYNLTDTYKVLELFDALLVLTHPTQGGYIYAVSFSMAGAKLVSPDVNTSGFTRRLMGSLGFEEGWSGRLWRGFHFHYDDGVYDASGRLLYNDHVKPTKGIFMEYTPALIEKLTWLIHSFGVMSGERKLRRQLSSMVDPMREYGYGVTGALLVKRHDSTTIVRRGYGDGPMTRQRSKKTKKPKGY